MGIMRWLNAWLKEFPTFHPSTSSTVLELRRLADVKPRAPSIFSVHHLSSRLPFRGVEVSQNRSALLCSFSPPEMRSGRKISTCGWLIGNAVAKPRMCLSAWRPSFIDFTHFMVVTAQIIPLVRPIAPFTQPLLPNHGNHGRVLLWAHLRWGGLVLSYCMSRHATK